MDCDGLYGGDPVRPRYNIAPTITVPVVRLEPRVAAEDAARQIEPMRWGLVPSWAKDISVGSRMFNARAESLAEKAAFRTALAKRRCLIPASGYYEWKMLACAEAPSRAPPDRRARAGEGRQAAVLHDAAGRFGDGVRRAVGVLAAGRTAIPWCR